MSSTHPALTTWAVPYIGAATALLTLIMLLHLTLTSDHLPPWVDMPVISLCGCLPPERHVYRVGFTLVSVLLTRTVYLFKSIMGPVFRPQYPTLFVAALVAGAVAVSGIFVQGIVPLQTDCVDALLFRKGPITTDSIVHQSLAGVFFLTAFTHSSIVVFMFTRTSNDIIRSSHVSYYLKVTLLCIPALTTFASMAYHPTVVRSQQEDMVYRMRVAGVSQWAVVLSYIAYFGTYGLDFKRLLARQQRRLS